MASLSGATVREARTRYHDLLKRDEARLHDWSYVYVFLSQFFTFGAKY